MRLHRCPCGAAQAFFAPHEQGEERPAPQLYSLAEDAAALPDDRPGRRRARAGANGVAALSAAVGAADIGAVGGPAGGPLVDMAGAADAAAGPGGPEEDEAAGLDGLTEDEAAADAAALPDPLTLSDVRPTRAGRCALFWRDEAGEHFLYSVDSETAARHHLAGGLQLDGAALRALRQESLQRRTRDAALTLLARCSHAEAQLYRKLCRRFDAPTAADAVAEMRRLGLVNDAEFARRRAQLLAQRGRSRREAESDLAALGIPRELREEALAPFVEDEEARLRALVQKHYAAKLAAGRREAVYAALLRRGWPGALVRRVLADAARQDVPEDIPEDMPDAAPEDLSAAPDFWPDDPA